MLNSKEIIDIINHVNGSTVDGVHYEHKDFVLKVTNQGSGKKEGTKQEKPVSRPVQKEEEKPHEAQSPDDSRKESTKNELDTHTITASMVGVFYDTPSPDEPAFIQEGDTVDEDTVVCVLEAMKMFNDVHADVKGTVKEILVNNGELVEFGQPLFVVEPA
ncbi:acetyl-CoA carboxylase biotin carboxyl carrier protein [Halobacillus mangrovi]|uniref:Biotin carboxyl carrier protein of acetyl-CoA carboxylase n=1 Tax=Halobacillus mangrovi TaxID=402384 RepID=A0A1W5ZQS7_9BACI|nr:acetyl-CoA carboxylase biotin carboxyl carrier protein [Halobacillus mangrovi]ARI75643.1 acetyl-CoA carboxylase, biotin carboxyl carrier protein [Halobacillus mangrovi]